ncbi:P-loop NTPase [Candidatus Woesearchaeota archaeon]|nr:P-loop NTPase [Candidatus Woesearchaeota archaeon]
MTKLIGILSGKGGVGKTTLAINLTTALSLLGQDSVLIDADLTKANVSVHLGAYRCTTTLHEVLWQQKSIQDALYLHPSGLRFVPAGISLYHAKNTTPELIKGLPAHTKGIATSVILDGPLGASGQLPAFLSILDELIVVTTPDLPSLSDTLRVLQEAQQHPVAIKGVVVNRAHFNAFEIDQESIAAMLQVPVLSVLPEHMSLREALKKEKPLVSHDPHCEISKAFKKLASRVIDEEYHAIIP